MSVDIATVKKIASLARIAITEEEAARIAPELDNIMGWIEQLGEVDVTGVEPMAGVQSRDLPRRADVINDGGDPEKVLKNAPDSAHGFFVVPKVVE